MLVMLDLRGLMFSEHTETVKIRKLRGGNLVYERYFTSAKKCSKFWVYCPALLVSPDGELVHWDELQRTILMLSCNDMTLNCHLLSWALSTRVDMPQLSCKCNKTGRNASWSNMRKLKALVFLWVFMHYVQNKY